MRDTDEGPTRRCGLGYRGTGIIVGTVARALAWCGRALARSLAPRGWRYGRWQRHRRSAGAGGKDPAGTMSRDIFHPGGAKADGISSAHSPGS